MVETKTEQKTNFYLNFVVKTEDSYVETPEGGGEKPYKHWEPGPESYVSISFTFIWNIIHF
jgi:hypothetical protein